MPNVDLVQEEPFINLFNGSLSATPIELQSELFKQDKLGGPTLIYRDKTDGNIYGMPIKNISIETEFHIQTAFVRLEITFVYNGSKNRQNNLNTNKMATNAINKTNNNKTKSNANPTEMQGLRTQTQRNTTNIIENDNLNDEQIDALFALPLTTNGTKYLQ